MKVTREQIYFENDIKFFGAQSAVRKRRNLAQPKKLIPFSKLICEHRFTAFPVFHPKNYFFL